MLSEQACPICGAKGSFEYYDDYERDLISVQYGKRVTKTLQVHRYCCNSCHHTHALLPEPLLPYSSYSLRFVIQVLCEYAIRQQTVEQLCEKYQIAHSTLYAFYHLFLSHKQLLLGVLTDMQQDSYPFLLDFSGKQAEEFFLTYHFSFLQRARTAAFHHR